MADGEGQVMSENTKLLHELLGAVRGIDGDSGLIGQVAKIGQDVTEIRVTIPTLATKAECATYREKCSQALGARRERRWTRAKDLLLVLFGSAGAAGALFGIGRGAGWW